MSLQDDFLISLFDAVSYAVVAMDTNGIVRFVNRPARDFLRQRGRDFDSCVGGPAEAILPIATPLALRAMEDEAFCRGEGRVVDKGKELFFEITPLRADGVLQGAAISLQRPERFEEMAHKMEAYQSLFRQLHVIFESSSDGIWVTDGDGTVTNVNQASMELNGLTREEVVGRNIRQIMQRGEVEQAVTMEVMKHKRQISLIQHVRSTGRQILSTGTPVFDDNGDLSLVVVNERDLTEINNLRRDLAIAKQSQESVHNEMRSMLMLELAGSDIVAESPGMRRVLTMALKLAQLNVSNILLTGESGVGKGLIAKFLHNNSRRKDRPFLSINCAALPESLFEAELFGYESGAFTGAREGGRMGLMNLAQDGTLFLDEVGEMPLSQQAKLLTCLDQLEYIPVGGSRPEKIACTLVFATNQDLEALVSQKKFRQDLYYRLSAFNLHIPPLRERNEDLFELARSVLAKCNAEFEADAFLSPEALELLQSHGFPGNVRELRSLIRTGVAMGEDSDLSAWLRHALGREAGGSVPRNLDDVHGSATLAEAVAATERALLLKAKAACGTTRAMARMLGVNQSTVVRKLARHGLAEPNTVQENGN